MFPRLPLIIDRKGQCHDFCGSSHDLLFEEWFSRQHANLGHMGMDDERPILGRPVSLD
jgi:hypothetical protein